MHTSTSENYLSTIIALLSIARCIFVTVGIVKLIFPTILLGVFDFNDTYGLLSERLCANSTFESEALFGYVSDFRHMSAAKSSGRRLPQIVYCLLQSGTVTINEH